MTVSTVSPVQSIVTDLLAGNSSTYASADVSTKAKVRAELKSDLGTALKSGDFATAQAVHAATELAQGSTQVKPKVEVDYTLLLAQKIDALKTAAYRLSTPEFCPEELASKIDFERLEELLHVEKELADEPMIDKLMSGAAKISTGTKAPASDLQAAFDGIDVESGTWLKVSEIQKATGLPSSGAIAARLFPKGKSSTLSGWTPEKASDGTLGARKN